MNIQVPHNLTLLLAVLALADASVTFGQPLVPAKYWIDALGEHKLEKLATTENFKAHSWPHLMHISVKEKNALTPSRESSLDDTLATLLLKTLAEDALSMKGRPIETLP